jgi:hypothetical protein
MAEAMVRVQDGVRVGRGPRYLQGMRGRRGNRRTEVDVQRAGVEGGQIHGDPD